MSWTIEEHIGEGRPWPSQVVVYRGETGESLAYASAEAVGKLEAENAELRELLRAMWVRVMSEYPRGGFPDMAIFEDELRYQGIEVDA